MKKINGITLISLIITIIVMLILAGIALTFSVGEKGIIERTQLAIREKERAEVEEIIITSYVFKTTASTNMVGKLNLEETAKSIYSNLTKSDYKLKTSTGAQAQSYEEIYTRRS